MLRQFCHAIDASTVEVRAMECSCCLIPDIISIFLLWLQNPSHPRIVCDVSPPLYIYDFLLELSFH
jgi:hypothetical protein